MFDLFRGWSRDDIELFGAFTAGVQGSVPGSSEALATLNGLRAVEHLALMRIAMEKDSPEPEKVGLNQRRAATIVDHFSGEIVEELQKAFQLHPEWPIDALHAVAIVGEEAGEVTKAVLQNTYQPAVNGADMIREELLQLAATTLRFLAELDRGCLRFEKRFDRPQ
jgi:NTP pyrophosphatase (non-canonical NTP hydrolase)